MALVLAGTSEESRNWNVATSKALPSYADHNTCFYCAKPVNGVGVNWMGSTAVIVLHPDCVIGLTIRLMRDVHESECNFCTIGDYQ